MPKKFYAKKEIKLKEIITCVSNHFQTLHKCLSATFPKAIPEMMLTTEPFKISLTFSSIKPPS